MIVTGVTKQDDLDLLRTSESDVLTLSHALHLPWMLWDRCAYSPIPKIPVKPLRSFFFIDFSE